MICNECSQDKDESELCKNKSKECGYNPICKVCQRKKSKAHYAANRTYYIQKAKIRCNDLRQWINEYKSSLKCEICGECHPACIDFHHKDSSKKDFEISKAVAKGFTKERVLEEIEKCQILCANCHRKLHWDEK